MGPWFKNLGFHALTVGVGIFAFFGICAALAVASGTGAESGRDDTAFAIGSGIFGLAALVGAIWLRKRRRRWIRQDAMYQSFSLFEALIAESGSPIQELGGMIFGGSGNAGLDLLLTIKDAVADGQASNTLRGTYDAVQARHAEGEIDEATFRQAIDQLFVAAGGK